MTASQNSRLKPIDNTSKLNKLLATVSRQCFSKKTAMIHVAALACLSTLTGMHATDDSMPLLLRRSDKAITLLASQLATFISRVSV